MEKNTPERKSSRDSSCQMITKDQAQQPPTASTSTASTVKPPAKPKQPKTLTSLLEDMKPKAPSPKQMPSSPVQPLEVKIIAPSDNKVEAKKVEVAARWLVCSGDAESWNAASAALIRAAVLSFFFILQGTLESPKPTTVFSSP